MAEQPITAGAVPQTQEQLPTGWLPGAGMRDGALVPLGYVKFTASTDAAYTLTQIATTIPANARTVVFYFETNGVRLRCDGVAPTQTTGTPRATGTDFVYTQNPLSSIQMCNSTAGQNFVVHVEFFT